MLPKPLVSIYREYKKDTNFVASWLASTAKACGYPADLLSDPPPLQQPKTSGRPKGKARTGGKKKGKVPAKSVSEPVATHIIAIKDFVPLAECISASKNPVIPTPDSFYQAITRVIAVRSSFSEKLNDHGVAPDARSNIKHSYFVGVLVKVHELLKPLVSTTASASSPDPIEVLNRFSGLSVYEPSEAFLNAPEIERPETTGRDNIIYEAEPQHSLADALAAFWMLLQDLRIIRDQISNIWSEFVTEDFDGSLDPASVAVAANTGIDFARSLIEDMLPIFKDYGGAFAVCEQYFVRVILQRTNSGEDLAPWTEEDEKHNFYDVASTRYYYTGTLINNLALLPVRNSVLVLEDDSLGVYDPTSNWEAKTGEEKFADDTILLTELFKEALTIVRHVPDFPIVDEFIRGVKEFHETQKVPFFLIFAAQITLDIHHIIGGYAGTAATSLLKQLSAMAELLQLHDKFHENLTSPHWSSSDAKSLRGSQEVLKWFIEDPLHKAKALVVGRERLGMIESIKKHRLLRRSPIIAGLALYHFRADMYEIGIHVTNAWGSIILPAHLYNAAPEEGLTHCLWYDMDFLMFIHGEDEFFVGKRPTDTADYLKRFLLQIGVSASFFTNRRRRTSGTKVNLSDFSRAGARFLKPGAPVSRSFLDRYWMNSGSIEWTPESIEHILSRSQVPERRGGISQAKLKHLRREGADSRHFTAAELLSSLIVAMQAEVEEFAFPYLMMHQLNWQILKAITKGCDDSLRETFGPGYMRHEWQLPFMVGHLLALADGIDGPGDDLILRKAGVAFDLMHDSGTVSAASRYMAQKTGLKFELPDEYKSDYDSQDSEEETDDDEEKVGSEEFDEGDD